MPLNLNQIRTQFPALQRNAIYLDNPAGTQVPHQVIDRIQNYLIEMNANTHGSFDTSLASDALIDEARLAAKEFLGASRPEEVIFGPNMTSLTFNISRSLAKWLSPRDEIVVTRLDHDANITPWTMIAEDRDCIVRWVDFDVETGELNQKSLENALENRPRIVAIGYASNALGTINPVKRIVQAAHDAGALVYVDAVQYAPHGSIDVQDLDCDFLACSSYKFFGPHLGLLYGKYELLEELKAYKVRPAEDHPPDKFETGTKNHEGIAGLLGALEYLKWIGSTFGDNYSEKFSQTGISENRILFKKGMTAIRAYEFEISKTLLEITTQMPRARLYGPSDPRQLENRVPTFAITVDGFHPQEVAEKLGDRGIYVWDGNYYAQAVTERLGLEETGGMVRIGPVHYNTLAEIQQFGEVLEEIIQNK